MSNLLDRVLETTATTGTGTYSLAGAATGFRTFVAGMADSHVVGSAAFYFAVGAPGGADANSWEFGYGTVTDASPDTLTRTVLLSSTGSAISWSSGVKYVMSTPPAALLMRLCRLYRGTSRPAWLPAQSLWLDSTGGVTAVLLKYFDGADDITLGTINETANTFAPANALAGNLGSTDNAVLRADGAGGTTAQGSPYTLADDGSGTIVGTNAGVTYQYNDDGSGIGPTVALLRNSASPAAADRMGRLIFQGKNTAATTTAYVNFIASISDPTAGSEDGYLELLTVIAGTIAQRFYLGAGLYGRTTTGGDPGDGEVNANNLKVGGRAVTDVIIATATPSSAAAVDFASGIDGTYDEYVLRGWMQPATDQVDLWLRFSDDGGSTYEADAADYNYAAGGNGATYHAASVSTGDSKIRLTTSSTTDLVGNAATEYIEFEIVFARPSNTSAHKLVRFDCAWLDTAGEANRSYGSGAMLATAAANGARLMFSSGNVAAGFVELIGRKKA